MTTEQLNKRQKEALSVIEESGFVTIEALASMFEVSQQTVRRDIILMDNLHLVERFHGGAGTLSSSKRSGYIQKQIVNTSGKIAIGHTLSLVIPLKADIYLDFGTTVETASLIAVKGKTLNIHTSSCATAMSFQKSGNENIYVIGGKISGKDGSLTGSQTTEQLDKMRFDYALIGCSAIETDGSILDFDANKIAMKKLAMKRAKRKILLVDSTKFGKTSRECFAQISDFDLIIIDQQPHHSFNPALEQAKEIRMESPPD
ncbi:DeoR/GlpR family DNA-binding transcription regulator [Marinomonas foliarum]|uniref:DeoR family transcriptional regulator n=1 Tax=Marinomonas foliarum TaxID=491950 RepID=A0A369AJ55_9GAMM|nr:DeoR/GlpR family DNA-binding transcription regulator [Marinomonas foliarum]QRV25632.1 DeoR/GlpR transcriptional regulator [Marinomonas foliarum]RCX08316.1 DeoR family transcriptional regulator [Marinomonas foliarum]